MLLAQSDITGALNIMLVGMLVVFVSLSVLAVLVRLLDMFCGEDEPTPNVRAVSKDDPRLIAVIAAAATVALGQQVRVQKIKPLDESSK